MSRKGQNIALFTELTSPRDLRPFPHLHQQAAHAGGGGISNQPLHLDQTASNPGSHLNWASALHVILAAQIPGIDLLNDLTG
jgi:hypothetical protein